MIEALMQNSGARPGFNIVLYTGNATAGHSITGVGFEPGFVWIKERDGTAEHSFITPAMGIQRSLCPNSDRGQVADDRMTSMDADGFTLTNNEYTNSNGKDYVAWCWKADITAPAGEELYSLESNFSIVEFTGNATAGRAVPHSLGTAPSAIFVKNRSNITDWRVYFSIAGATAYRTLNEDIGRAFTGAVWDDTDPTDTEIYVGSENEVNGSGDNIIMFVFGANSPFNAVGGYDGNGSTTGPVIDCGFAPDLVMIKNRNSTGDWRMYDSLRDTTNPNSALLIANDVTAETTTSTWDIDFTSTGFQIKSTDADVNTNLAKYDYYAWKRR